MISNLLNTLSRGWSVLKTNGRLWFVVCLLFLFPLLFILLIEHTFEAAYNNVETSQLRQVDTVHNALVSLLQNQDSLQFVESFASAQLTTNKDLTEIRIVERTNEGLRIVWSANPNKVGTVEEATDIYDSAPQNGQSFIFPVIRDGDRVWQAVRVVRGMSGQQYYIVSEHSLAKIDEIMSKRKQNAYWGLGAIFLFLIALAYWLNRQTDWKQQHTALEQTLEERDLFINMITHEFRTPLTAIKGYASLLDDSETLKVNERQHIEKISLSTERLLALVNDFLEVARIQSGKLQLQKELVDVRTVCDEVAKALSPMASEKGLTLTIPTLIEPITLMTDHQRLYQVLQNLVSNAIKYTKTGSVDFSLEESPLAVTIRIKDSGMGISAEDQQKLFAPFARVGGVESSTITGTGLGMWITKKLVELLGGTIAVESIKNVGTHVVLTFSKRKAK